MQPSTPTPTSTLPLAIPLSSPPMRRPVSSLLTR
nr:MAG TPA: hypothetical protein [Bacteriophage sp.]